MVDYDLVRVGGATGSLLGLAPRRGLQVGQTALYLAAAVWAVTLSSHRRGLVDPARWSSLVAGGVALVLSAVLFLNQGDDFTRRPVALHCEGSPPVCLAPGYDRDQEAVIQTLAPYLQALDAVRAPLPKRFVQDPLNEEGLVGVISNEFALGDASEARYALIGAYLPYECDFVQNPALRQAWMGVIEWLDAIGGNPIRPDDPTVPDVLKHGSADEQAAWIRDSIGRLRSCA
jgi:hypothetical protein